MTIDYFQQQFGEDNPSVGPLSQVTAPDYDKIIADAYATIGRTGGIGEGDNQIDTGGRNHFYNMLETGAVKPEDFGNVFSGAVDRYLAEKPDDRYTQYVNNYRAGLAGANTDGANVANTATGALIGATADTANNGAITGATSNTTGSTTGDSNVITLNNNNIDAFGDSTTFGYNAGNQLDSNMVTSAQNTLGEGYTINNMGVNSTTVGDLLSNVDGNNSWANSLAGNSGVVVLNYGLNEASRGEDTATFRANLLNAVNQAKAAGKTVILQTPNVVGSDIGWGNSVASYADIIRDVASSTGSALDDKFSYTSGLDNIFDTNTGDTLHPSGSTYSALGVNLANTISGLNANNTVGATTGANAGTLTTLAQNNANAASALSNEYLKANPDVASAYATHVANNGSMTADQFASSHYSSQGAEEGRDSPFKLSGELAKSTDLKNGTYLTTTGDIVDASGNTIRSTGSATTATLTNQILGQNLTDKWEGQGKGSAQANAADIASILNGIGVTDIKDFGVIPAYVPAQEIGKFYNGQYVRSVDLGDGTLKNVIYQGTGQLDSEGNEIQTLVEVPQNAKLTTLYGQDNGNGELEQVDPSKIKTVNGQQVIDTGQTTYGNKKTGQAVPNTYGERQVGNAFGGTYEGKGNTAYRVDFSSGTPRFYTTGASSSDIGQLQPFLALASFIPGVAPFAMAANAAISASQGNWAGAILSGLGASGAFAGGVMSEIDALANAGDFAGAHALWEGSVLAQNAGNIATATNVARGLNAIDKGNIAGVINAGLTLGGVSVSPEVRTVANLFNAATAIGTGDTAAMLDAASSLTGSSDARLAASALRFKDAIESGDATAIINATKGFTSTVKSSTDTSQVFKTFSDKIASGETVENTFASLSSGTDADVNLPSGLQLAGVSNGTVSDAGSGFTLGGVDANTQATLDAMKGIDKIGTTVSNAPSWVVVAKGEEVTGNRLDSEGRERFTITRANPNNPDEPVIYDVIKDPETGEVSYEWGGIAFDENANVVDGGTTVSSGSKPSWTWDVKTDATVGSEDAQVNNATSGLTSVDTVDGKKGATGTLTTLSSDAGTTGAEGTVGVDGSGTKGTVGNGTLGTDGAGTQGTDGTGTKDGTGGGGDGTGGDGDGTGGGGTDATVVNNDDGTTTTLVVTDDGKVTTHTCAEGYHWDEATQACVANTKIVTPPVINTPVVNTPVVRRPVTMTSPLSSVGTPPPVLDTSERMLKGAPAQKRMELAKLQQLFASLTPEMAAVLSERGFEPPKFREDKVEEASPAKAETSVFGNLSDELYKPTFMATGGKVFESMMPKFIEHPKHLSAAPVVGTGGVDAPLKLAALKHLYQSIGKPMRSLEGYAQGGLPNKYAKAAPKGHKPEFITGLTGYYAQGKGTGQSDDIPAMLHDGDYVIDADAVAALGDGSSKAGAEALSEFQSKVPHSMSTGGQAVPAKIADGEYVFPEAFVSAIGKGDNKLGAKRLDAMREELRAHKRSAPTSKIPPKAKSPLDYLRMAKG